MEEATWEGAASAAPGKWTGGRTGETASDLVRPEVKRHTTQMPMPDLSTSEEPQNHSSALQPSQIGSER